jgi:DNA-binding Lrp family transcriptional regulator
VSAPQKVVEYVSKRETISIEEMMQDLNVSRTTAKNYLSRLVKMGVVKRIGRGLYIRGGGSTAIVKLSPELSQIAYYLRQHFPMAQFVIWSINMLAEYAHYAVSRDLIVIETSKILSPSIRDALIEQGYHAILNPEKKDFQDYTYYPNKTIYLLERSEKYGLIEIENLLIPAPERIWIDIYYLTTRKELSFSPAELGRIFANMLRREGINFHRLLRCAQRRNIRDEIIILLYNLKQLTKFAIPDNLFVGKKEALKVIDEIVEGAKE